MGAVTFVTCGNTGAEGDGVGDRGGDGIEMEAEVEVEMRGQEGSMSGHLPLRAQGHTYHRCDSFSVTPLGWAHPR